MSVNILAGIIIASSMTYCGTWHGPINMCIRCWYGVQLLLQFGIPVVNVSTSPCEVVGPPAHRSWQQCWSVPGRRVWERTMSTAAGRRARGRGLEGWLTRHSSVCCCRRRRRGSGPARAKWLVVDEHCRVETFYWRMYREKDKYRWGHNNEAYILHLRLCHTRRQ